ncbi:MAG: methyltransferase domain-containing protein [Candidatus Hodarchaeota archaeon]
MSKDYIRLSYRRKMIDYLLKKYEYIYKGVVLDIGGRDRGRFKKPKKKVEKWIFADINPDYKPDIILNVSDMNQINSESIDIINAIELFEHVYEIKKGLKECYRVLKKNGKMIITVPFLSNIHSDPFDYQRWTSTKWKLELKKSGFTIEKFIIMGKFYTHLSEMMKTRIDILSRGGYILFRLIKPILDWLTHFDNRVKDNRVLDSYHNGYFIVANKN